MIEFEIKTKQQISPEDIGYLMSAALEGGINHWCGSASIKYNKDKSIYGVSEDDQEKVDYASDVIGYGGMLILTDVEESDGPWELTLEKFIEGIKKEMIRSKFGSVQDLMDNHDAETADCIVQFALFNEIVYG